MTLDDIRASTDTLMTPELIRLFRYVGCDPACHACKRKIRDGSIFKLVPHQKPGQTMRDEMCCTFCGDEELVARDKREAKAAAEYMSKHRPMSSSSSGFGVGYSRESKT